VPGPHELRCPAWPVRHDHVRILKRVAVRAPLRGEFALWVLRPSQDRAGSITCSCSVAPEVVESDLDEVGDGVAVGVEGPGEV
jgi:hypothetical protein